MVVGLVAVCVGLISKLYGCLVLLMCFGLWLFCLVVCNGVAGLVVVVLFGSL